MEPKFCLKCGAPLQRCTHENHYHYECTACDYIHWLNSRPCVEPVIIQNGKILFTKRALPPYQGYWDIPGGFLELGEDPVEGLHREMMEELGVTLEVIKLIGIY